MILEKKELEFYKWDGDLKQLLQNVRDKLNVVAEVSFRIELSYSPINLFLIRVFIIESLQGTIDIF